MFHCVWLCDADMRDRVGDLISIALIKKTYQPDF